MTPSKAESSLEVTWKTPTAPRSRLAVAEGPFLAFTADKVSHGPTVRVHLSELLDAYCTWRAKIMTRTDNPIPDLEAYARWARREYLIDANGWVRGLMLRIPLSRGFPEPYEPLRVRRTKAEIAADGVADQQKAEVS